MRPLLRIALVLGLVGCSRYFTRVDPRVGPEDGPTCSPLQGGADCRPRDPRKPVQPGRTPADTFARDTGMVAWSDLPRA